jgi:hypothetical protein
MLGLRQYQLPSLWLTEISVDGPPGTNQLDKYTFLQFTIVARFSSVFPATEGSGERIFSTLEGLFSKSDLSAWDDLTITQLTIRLHELWHKLQ